jgi:hypothetical protein
VAKGSIDVLGLDDLFGRFDALLVALTDSKKLFARIGNYVRESTQERTVEQHRGPDGPWVSPRGDEYSDDYKAFREEYGRPVDHVYLDWYGGMWGALTQHSTETEVKVFFKATASRALPSRKKGGKKKKKGKSSRASVTQAEKAFYLHQDRPFFLLSEAQIKHIETMIDKHLTNTLEKQDG